MGLRKTVEAASLKFLWSRTNGFGHFPVGNREPWKDFGGRDRLAFSLDPPAIAGSWIRERWAWSWKGSNKDLRKRW